MSGLSVLQRLQRRGLEPLVDSVCERHHVPRADVLGRRRHASIQRARNALYAALRETGLSTVEIGYLLDRDHTTVLHGSTVAGYVPPAQRLRVAG